MAIRTFTWSHVTPNHIKFLIDFSEVLRIKRICVRKTGLAVNAKNSLRSDSGKEMI